MNNAILLTKENRINVEIIKSFQLLLSTIDISLDIISAKKEVELSSYDIIFQYNVLNHKYIYKPVVWINNINEKMQIK